MAKTFSNGVSEVSISAENQSLEITTLSCLRAEMGREIYMCGLLEMEESIMIRVLPMDT